MTTRKKTGPHRDADDSKIQSLTDLMEIMPYVQYNGKVYSSVALVAIYKLLTDQRIYRAVIGSFEAAQKRSRARQAEINRRKRARRAESEEERREQRRKNKREYYQKNKAKFAEYQRRYREKKSADKAVQQ